MITLQTPIEMYLAGDFQPDAEFSNGKVEERSVGELNHALWQRAIQWWFLQHEEEWQIVSLVEVRVQYAPENYQVPDVTVIDRALANEQIITRPPLAAFEVLSPEDRMSRIMAKLRNYDAMGIPVIRLVDPATNWIAAFSGGSLYTIHSETTERCSTVQIDWQKIREKVVLT